MLLSGKTARVTGGASGIGAATARRLAAGRARVGASYVTGQTLDVSGGLSMW